MEKRFKQFLFVKQGQTQWTVRCHLGRLRRFLAFAGDDITREQVEKYLFYLKDKGYSNATTNSYIFFFKLLEKYLDDTGKPTVLIKNFKISKVERPVIDILSDEEIKLLIRTNPSNHPIEETYSYLIQFLALTGCRINEAVSLKVRNVSLAINAVTFTNTKSKRTRKAYLLTELYNSIEKLIKGKELDELVFTNSRGGMIYPNDFNISLHKRAKMLGIKKRVYPHLFRHTFASRLVMEGVDISLVAELLGHENIETTYNNYISFSDEALRKSIYKLPLIRETIDPKEIIKHVLSVIKSFKLDEDYRLTFKLGETPSSIDFSLSANTELSPA